jgi:hypothetical protein
MWNKSSWAILLEIIVENCYRKSRNKDIIKCDDAGNYFIPRTIGGHCGNREGKVIVVSGRVGRHSKGMKFRKYCVCVTSYKFMIV